MVDKWIGKIAVVTGSSSGIGAAIFKAFAKNGINVIGLARRVDRTQALIDELGDAKGKAFACKCDVSNQESVDEAFKWIEKEFGSVNILVNNAGIGRKTKVLDANPEALTMMNEVIDTNLRGLLQCTREAYRLMKKSDDHGLIININSILGHHVTCPWNINPATKFAVTALTETIRLELVAKDDKKVRITSLSPGLVDTEITIASGVIKPGEPNPFTNLPAMTSEDIAESVMFLLSTPYSVIITELTMRPVGEKF